MLHTQGDENNSHFHVRQRRLPFLMAAMSGKERVMLRNAMVWGKGLQVGVFHESKICRCALGGVLKKAFLPYVWEARWVLS